MSVTHDPIRFWALLQRGRTALKSERHEPDMRGGTAYCTVVISDRPSARPSSAIPITWWP